MYIRIHPRAIEPLVISITRVLNIDSDICTCLQTEVKYEEIYKYVLSLHFSDVH